MRRAHSSSRARSCTGFGYLLPVFALAFAACASAGIEFTDDAERVVETETSQETEQALPDERMLFEDMPLVVTASRRPQRLLDAPATIDVITAAQIESSGAGKLAELLERLPGIYTPTAHTALDMLWIRGVGRGFNDNALLLIDGVPYRSLYQSNFPINEQIPLADIARIEVIRGPGSALYGSNAFTGVINILSKDAIDIGGGQLATAYGSYASQNHQLQAATTYAQGEASIYARYLDGDGYHARYNDEGGRTKATRSPHNTALHLQASYLDLDFGWRHSRFELNDFTAVPGDEEGGLSRREDSMAQLAYEHSFSPRLSLQFKGYYNAFEHDKTQLAYDEEPTSARLFDTRESARISGADLVLTRGWSERHYLLFGVNAEYEQLLRAYTRARARAEDPVAYSEWAGDRSGPQAFSHGNWALYLEDELTFTRGILTAGLRYDALDASGSRLSPRLSAVLNASARDTFKLRYGQAFRAPTFEELYRRSEDAEGEGNLRLKPQLIATSELEYARRMGARQRFSATLFHTEFENFIAVEGDGDFENQDPRRYHGLELAWHGEADNGVDYFANYSWTEGQQNEADIGALPRHMANLGLGYRALTFLDVHAHVRMVGARIRPDNYQDDVEPEARRDQLDGYVLLNMTVLFKQLPGSLQARLSLRNLLDEDYATPGDKTEDFDIRQPGRTVDLLVSWSW